jgi:hypothetical protein
MRNLIPIALISSFLFTTSAVRGAEDPRSYAAARHALVLGGGKAELLKSVSGGDIAAPVIDEAGGPGGIAKRHIGPPRYEELALQLDLNMSDQEVDLIAGMWKNDLKRIDGSIIDTDFQMDARSERKFSHALVTETTFPAIGGAEKEAGFITVKLAPETIQRTKASGKVSVDLMKGRERAWIPSNFKLEIDGLECKQVMKIDSFTVKRTLPSQGVGEARDYQKEPGKLEFPILRITLTESSAATWIAWLEDFVIKGNSDDSKEKSGTLTLLAANRQDPVARIKLSNLGICRLKQDDSEAGSEQAARIVVDLYVERMEFQAGKSLGPDAPPTKSDAPPATDPAVRRRPSLPGLPPPVKK